MQSGKGELARSAIGQFAHNVSMSHQPPPEEFRTASENASRRRSLRRGRAGVIEVHDNRGGLAAGNAEMMFKPLSRRDGKTGVR
jgi:hypothetical protein